MTPLSPEAWALVEANLHMTGWAAMRAEPWRPDLWPEIEDVALDALIEVARTFRDRDHENGAPFSALARLRIRARLVDRVRRNLARKRRITLVSIDFIRCDAIDPVGLVEPLPAFDEMTTELPDADREVLRLRFVEEVSVRKIAAVRQVARRTIYRSINRSLDRLASRFF